jgi:NAD(P)-dependent dehydrogenase (short-subunit alcohol dehydrogenase family)
MKLNGKTAIVTGGAKGIGAAIARKLAGEGAAVVIADVDETKAAETAESFSLAVLTGRAPYCISKAGVNALTAVLGAEWAAKGIRVNAVAPGWILTELLPAGMKAGVVSEPQILSVTPIQRLATPNEIADVVRYLCTDESRYIIGQTIFVDGGWSVQGLPQKEYINPDMKGKGNETPA